MVERLAEISQFLQLFEDSLGGECLVTCPGKGAVKALCSTAKIRSGTIPLRGDVAQATFP